MEAEDLTVDMMDSRRKWLTAYILYPFALALSPNTMLWYPGFIMFAELTEETPP